MSESFRVGLLDAPRRTKKLQLVDEMADSEFWKYYSINIYVKC